MRILGKASSINVRKVLWTCAELGLEYQREDWGSGFRDPREPAFLALNPNAQVPVLIDGDFVLWESNSILRYLANQAQALYPAGLRQRARTDQWLDWQATDLNSAWRDAFMGLVRGAAIDASRIAASCAAWRHAMGVLEWRLAETGAYVAGDEFTIADIAIGLSVQRYEATPFERPDLPAVTRYRQRLNERAGFRDFGEI